MAQIDQIRERLLADREQARQRVTKLETDLELLTKSRQSESDDDEHDPEGETLSAQWSMRSGLLANARDTSMKVEAAIARLDEGTYGICKICSKPIPEAQLEARSFREECVQCAS